MKHGRLGIALVVLALVFVALVYNFRHEEQNPVLMPASIPATAEVEWTAPHTTIPTVPAWPEFNCQEDEVMEWVDARNTAHCVNIEEFFVRELEKRVE